MEEVDSVLVDNVKSFASGGFGGIWYVLSLCMGNEGELMTNTSIVLFLQDTLLI